MTNIDDVLKRFDARQADKPKLERFKVSLDMNILGKSYDEAAETLEMLIKNLNKFEDLENVKGEML